MIEKEFLEKAAREFGLSDLIAKLENKNKGYCRIRRDIDLQGRPDNFLLSPIIKEGDITFLYAAKGVGKTCLALPIAYAVSLGDSLFDLWRSPKKRVVLYVDGEIGEAGLNLRCASVRQQFSLAKNQETNVRLLSDRFNLYTSSGRELLERAINDVNDECPAGMKLSFMVLDNLTSMVGGHDKPEQWDEFFTWAKGLTNMGISLLILYHANRDGGMRGSQMKSINADNLIYLENVSHAEEGADDPKSKNKKRSKTDKLPHDRSAIAIRVIPENLRNNQFPEAYIPIDIEYSVIDTRWTMLRRDDYIAEVLKKQSLRLSDEEMSPFWGMTDRQVKELRRKFDIKKYKNGSPKGGDATMPDDEA